MLHVAIEVPRIGWSTNSALECGVFIFRRVLTHIYSIPLSLWRIGELNISEAQDHSSSFSSSPFFVVKPVLKQIR